MLAFEAGPTSAGPVFDLSASAAQSTCALTFYSLPNKTSGGQTVTITADQTITGKVAFEAASTGFTGKAKSTNKGMAAGGTFTSATYKFSGGPSAGPSGQSLTATGTITASAGAPAQTSNMTFSGITVAPIQSVVGSNTNAGFVLVGDSATMTVTVTNTGHGNLDTSVPLTTSNLKGTVGKSGSSVFAGSGGTLAGPETGLRDGQSQTFTYTFTPNVQNSVPVTANIVAKFNNGNSSGDNTAQTVTSVLSGQGVAPVNQVSSVSPVYARVGSKTAATSSVTITNMGNGNLDTSVAQSVSNLNGSTKAISGTNWVGGANTFSLQDSAAETFDYTYSPQNKRGQSSKGTVTINFSNGSSNLKNNAQNLNVSLVGSTVGPVYQSSWPGGTVNTPPPNQKNPTTTINWGTVGSGGGHQELLTLTNVSTYPNSGDHTLTDLSIKSFTIAGKNPGSFSIPGGVTDILSEGGSEIIDIGFSATTPGAYSATLTLDTDQGAAFGGSGDVFLYNLEAFVTVFAAEPASLLLLGFGLGGVLLIRGRRYSAGHSPAN